MPPISQNADSKVIILAGATGELGQHIASFLQAHGANVRALVREKGSGEGIVALENLGVKVVKVDYNNAEALKNACVGGSCVVSALSGLREVIVDAQTRLLRAAASAGVPRFIPSDFSIDFTKLAPGSNRNLDLRREFLTIIDQSAISATSVLNGMFTDLLTGQAPVVLSGIKRVMYWGSADQLMDFTTIRDTAAYTALAALDDSTPRFLRIAGDVANIHDLQRAASEASGVKYGTLRAGSLGFLATMIKITKTVAPQKDEVFPPWQGMQYLHNMLTGKPKLVPLDNNRYPQMRWTSIREVLASKG